ncbi:hypothetical protein M011DRAFT_406860 [Sporormia fimetaria CBS 119925]|uniref:Uncharacterized protein n=1 Tax=Sporormia fimetaria CBS 119925 TaxID=1340428 RepID=A0A6A6V474_9PLEO|nr:hypothetical protein M011DRAFT_406860 [Sporormia fimetaria CBS 119925]
MPDDQPWTTSRCNRLLRPISSRLSTLRKQLEHEQRVAGEGPRGSHASWTDASAKTSASQGVRSRKPRCFDPEWNPTAKSESRNKRTYGGRNGKRAGAAQNVTASISAPRPDGVVSTPFVVRSGPRFLDSPQLQFSPVCRRKREGWLFAQTRIFKEQMPPDTAKLVAGLLDAYGKLLKATDESDQYSSQGTKSLLRTCLQKMPNYMALEEHFAELDREEEDIEEDRDVCDEIYTELEQFFSPSHGTGWRHFKEMVRAHGTSLLCDAFAEGMLGLDALDAVVKLCIEASAFDEAEKLLWTYLPSIKPIGMPASLQAEFRNATPVYLRLVMTYVAASTRHGSGHGFDYDLLGFMLAQGLLPLEWLATDCMHPIWNRLVRSLAESDDGISGHAVRFLQTFMCLACGLPDDDTEEEPGQAASRQLRPSVRQDFRGALNTTISDLLALLASAVLVGHDQATGGGKDHITRVTWALDSLVIGLLRRTDIECSIENLETTPENILALSQRAFLIVTAASIVHMSVSATDEGNIILEAATLFEALNWLARKYSRNEADLATLLGALPPFTSKMIFHAGKKRGDAGTNDLRRFTSSLLSLGSIRLPHRLWTLKRLALDTCTDYAQCTNDSAHFAYTREVETMLSSQGRVLLLRSPSKYDTPSAPRGLRLEEGIGEWVACTPFPQKKAQTVRQQPPQKTQQLPSPANTKASGWDTGPDFEEGNKENGDPNASSVSHVTGKRTRASSPKVVVPFKRIRLQHSSPIPLFDAPLTLSDDPNSTSTSSAQQDIRQSRRTLAQKAQPSRVRAGRTLRHTAPKSYAEDYVGDSTDSDEGDRVAYQGRGGIKKSRPRRAIVRQTISAQAGSQNVPPRGRDVPLRETRTFSLQNNDRRMKRYEVLKKPGRASPRLQQKKLVRVEQTKRRTSRPTQRLLPFVFDSFDDDDSEDELSSFA